MMDTTDAGQKHDAAAFAEVRATIDAILAEAAKIYVGQEEFVRLALAALFAGGHVLIESVPGGKPWPSRRSPSLYTNRPCSRPMRKHFLSTSSPIKIGNAGSR